MFFRLLLESFRRQRRRKLLAGIAILLGTTAVTAMLALATTLGDRLHRELAVYGANIVMTPEADALAVRIGGVDLKPATGNAYLRESDLTRLRGIFWANNITGVSPELTLTRHLEQPGAPPDQEPGVTVVGLWFHHSLGDKGSPPLVTGAEQLHPWWKVRGAYPSAARDVLVGSALATELKLGINDRLNIRTVPPGVGGGQSGQDGLGYRIVGIVSAGDATDHRVLMPLESAQSLANLPGAVSRVELSARTRPEDAFARKDPDSLSPKQKDLWYCRPYANSIVYQIHEAIPSARAEQVRRVEQTEGSVLEHIGGLMWLVAAAALLAAGFAVSAAMATAILERRREIGLMRSLGASRASIALLFYAESAILAVLAGSFGYLAGSLLSAWLGARVFTSDGVIAPSLPTLNPVLLPIVLALALTVAVLGSTPSIRHALRLDPSHVLRADA